MDTTKKIGLLGAWLLGACGSVAGPDFEGKPLASLRGSVSGLEGEGGDAVLIWGLMESAGVGNPNCPTVGTAVPIEPGESSFTIDILDPPPTEAMIEDAVPFAFAQAQIREEGSYEGCVRDEYPKYVECDTPEESNCDQIPFVALQRDPGPHLYYFAADLPEDDGNEETSLDRWVIGAVDAGFHLMEYRESRVEPGCEEGAKEPAPVCYDNVDILAEIPLNTVLELAAIDRELMETQCEDDFYCGCLGELTKEEAQAQAEFCKNRF